MPAIFLCPKCIFSCAQMSALCTEILVPCPIVRNTRKLVIIDFLPMAQHFVDAFLGRQLQEGAQFDGQGPVVERDEAVDGGGQGQLGQLVVGQRDAHGAEGVQQAEETANMDKMVGVVGPDAATDADGGGLEAGKICLLGSRNFQKKIIRSKRVKK